MCGDQESQRVDGAYIRSSTWLADDGSVTLHRLRSLKPPGYGLTEVCAQAITKGETIKVFNHGNHRRDFTYIDDTVEGMIRVLNRPASPTPKWSSENPDPSKSRAPWRFCNIGNNRPANLMDYIGALERALGKEAMKEFLPIQLGDVPDT